LDFGGLLDF